VPSVDAWAGNTFPLGDWLDDIHASVDTARILADKAVSVILVRARAELAAQSVRIEDLRDRPRRYQTEAGETALAEILILGYSGHPTITDTDIQRGDRFALDGAGYKIVAVVPGLQHSLQAFATMRA